MAMTVRRRATFPSYVMLTTITMLIAQDLPFNES